MERGEESARMCLEAEYVGRGREGSRGRRMDKEGEGKDLMEMSEG